MKDEEKKEGLTATERSMGIYRIREKVGDVVDLANLDDAQIEAMTKLVKLDNDARLYIRMPLVRSWIDDFNYVGITAMYLLSNWLVWKLYKRDRSTAEAYQGVCDFIDDEVFKKWEGTAELEYFIRNTD